MSGNILFLGKKSFEIPPFFQTRPGDLGKKVHACSLRFSALNPLVTLPMVPEVLTKVHSAQFPGFSFLKWRIAMPLIIERSLCIINGLCKVADSDYQVSKRSILDSAGKGRLSLKKNIFLRLCWFHFGLKIKRGPEQLDPSPR